MGMRIPSSNMGASAMSSTGGAAKWQQQRQNMGDLSQALQTGDLAGAQKAFSAIAANSTKAADPNGPLGKVGAALQSGDLKGAEQAFAAMRSSGHHHHAGASASTQTAAASASKTPAQSPEQQLASLLSTLNGNSSSQADSNQTPSQMLASLISSFKSGIGNSYSGAQNGGAAMTGNLLNILA